MIRPFCLFMKIFIIPKTRLTFPQADTQRLPQLERTSTEIVTCTAIINKDNCISVRIVISRFSKS